MQKWEYLRFVILPDKTYGLNGVIYKFQQNENSITIMNKLGKEGWELVSQPTNEVSTFKRPLDD